LRRFQAAKLRACALAEAGSVLPEKQQRAANAVRIEPNPVAPASWDGPQPNPRAAGAPALQMRARGFCGARRQAAQTVPTAAPPPAGAAAARRPLPRPGPPSRPPAEVARPAGRAAPRVHVPAVVKLPRPRKLPARLPPHQQLEMIHSIVLPFCVGCGLCVRRGGFVAGLCAAVSGVGDRFATWGLRAGAPSGFSSNNHMNSAPTCSLCTPCSF
jgi:hypothetical protein